MLVDRDPLYSKHLIPVDTDLKLRHGKLSKLEPQHSSTLSQEQKRFLRFVDGEKSGLAFASALRLEAHLRGQSVDVGALVGVEGARKLQFCKKKFEEKKVLPRRCSSVRRASFKGRSLVQLY